MYPCYLPVFVSNSLLFNNFKQVKTFTLVKRYIFPLSPAILKL